MISKLLCSVFGHNFETHRSGPFGLVVNTRCTRCGHGWEVQPGDAEYHPPGDQEGGDDGQ